MEPIKLLPGSEPFFFPGNEIGCLLIHGFTGTPFEMRWLGEHLNHQGYTVHGPRLAGHGSTPADLNRATWREWYISALAGYEMLRSQCEKVFVMGLSMGGALSLLLAGWEPVAGVVAMSAPYQLSNCQGVMSVVVPLLGLVMATMPKGYPPPEEDPFQQYIMAVQRERGEEPLGHPTYSVWPLRAGRQLCRMLAEMRATLPRVTAPALLIHSQADQTVPFGDLQRHYEALGSPQKRKLVLEKSDHVVTEHVERDIVFKAITDFVEEHR